MSRASIRGFNLVASFLGIIVFSPLLLGLALAVRLTSPGPALFRSLRVGRNGRPFTLYKFRTMVNDVHAIGPAITSANDSRVTALGKRLRSHKLDELPQLLNVVLGDMSLVGPRPEDPRYVVRYSRQQLAVLDVRPGITSPASLLHSDEERELTGDDWQDHYLEQVLPEKLAVDLEYIRTRTLLSDLKVLLQTAQVFRGKEDPGA